jgi:microcystin degradation protein MlrC
VPPGSRRIALGALLQESNSFSPGRTTIQSFHNRYYAEGAALVEALGGTGTEIGGALAALAGLPVEPVPLVATNGGSGPIVAAATHVALKQAMLARLAAAGPVDGVYLALHGAMVAEGVDDVEGDLLDAVRAAVGPAVPVAVTLDLHAHVTPRMTAAAQIIIGYKHYPHDDAAEVGGQAARLLVRTIAGEIAPRMALRKVPALFAPHRERTDGDEPLAAFNRWARAAERHPAVLSVSYFPVQPWLDVPDMGFAALAVTDGDPARAAALAEEMAAMAWDRRAAFDVPVLPVDAGLRAALDAPPPVVLADTADCVGGGASGDSAVVLRHMLAAAIDVPSAMMIVDPETVAAARRAGVGAAIAARIGHKIDRSRGEPVATAARVERLVDGGFAYSGGMLGGTVATMGPSAVLAIGAIRVLVTTHPSYEWGDEQLRAAGLAPETQRFVVVKNPMNYKLTLGYARAAFVLDTPGPASPNLRALAWRRLARPFYPLDDGFWKSTGAAS